MPSQQLAIFDLDGVIIDSLPMMRKAFVYAYNVIVGRGTPPIDQFFAEMGKPLAEIMVALSLPAEMVLAYRQYSLLNQDELRLHPGAIECLRDLHDAGVITALYTGKELDRTMSVLKQFKLHTYFSDIVTGDQVVHPKPSGEGALLILHRLSVLPSAAVMIGDSPHDIACGRDAGAKTVGVLWGVGSRGHLANSDCLASAWHDVTGFITGMTKGKQA